VDNKRLLLGAGALPAFVVTALVCLYANHLFPTPKSIAVDTSGRLALAARWLLLPGLTLLAGVQYAARRGFIPGAIEGTRIPEDWGLEINLRYNQNTVEQVLLAMIAWAGLALALPHDQLGLIQAMAWLFVAGRATFYIGYRFHPLARGFGMVLTALPTLGAYVWLMWKALVR
jgi:hypothetical protein